MKTHHADNVRIKHKYLGYLKEAKGHAEASLDGVAQALDRFENYTHLRDFKAFHPEQAKAFKAHLTGQVSLRSGERLTQATLYSTLRHLRAFFHWLTGQPGYRSKLTYADADYFNLPANDARIAKTRRATPVPPGADHPRSCHDAILDRHRIAQPCLGRIRNPDRRPRRRPGFAQAQACRSRARPRFPGWADRLY